MRAILRYGWLQRKLAEDEDALTRMIEVGAGMGTARRLGLAYPGGKRVQAGLVAQALGLPASPFCLECTTSDRAATEALIGLGTGGLVLAAGGDLAAGVLIGEAPAGHVIEAEQSAVSEYPGLELGAPGYAEAAYLDLIRAASCGLRADLLALNPPVERWGERAARALGMKNPLTAPGIAGSLAALGQALNAAPPGARVLVVSYGAGSAADAILVTKGGA